MVSSVQLRQMVSAYVGLETLREVREPNSEELKEADLLIIGSFEKGGRMEALTAQVTHKGSLRE